jgi:hypothetical protein
MSAAGSREIIFGNVTFQYLEVKIYPHCIPHINGKEEF